MAATGGRRSGVYVWMAYGTRGDVQPVGQRCHLTQGSNYMPTSQLFSQYQAQLPHIYNVPLLIVQVACLAVHMAMAGHECTLITHLAHQVRCVALHTGRGYTAVPVQLLLTRQLR